ncbi:CRR6 family NdhI maturation factor [Candidatus Cyanaurora vandensis]|uniref:CRR6 family NdhI maturation factor n=1 Tax=Candidatus Cyanaurora vandensis TaxID=2714958 RepID=UPI0025804D17|nr:CRR6 family NdhI maturation factor [Candidatus Cyanaurora vandensis]
MDFTLDRKTIERLDLTGIQSVIADLSRDPIAQARQLNFQFDYPRDESDPRELSEIEEVRLWFMRLDARYPWLPYFLNWRAGELTRYAAMLVPHRFERQEGLVFNTEALQIFVLHKVFTVHDWLSAQKIQNHADLRYMAQTLGFDLDPAFFTLL